MSAHKLVRFESKNSYALINDIKRICNNGKATFSKEEGCWMVPQGALVELNRLDEEMTKASKDAWKEACKKCGFGFVKKGTNEYDKVIVEFKKIMKKIEDKKKNNEDDDDEEEFDMDNAVEVKQTEQTSKEAWKEACKKCGFDFVKKGTNEYDQVLVEFRNSMKKNEDKNNTNESDESEDEDVYD